MGSKTSFFVMDILLLGIFLAFISMVFNFNRYMFLGQLVLMLVLLFFAFIAVIGAYNDNNWAWSMLSVILFLIIFDFLWVYAKNYFGGVFFLAATLLTTIAFLMAVVKVGKKKEKDIEEKEPVYTNFDPGKYVGSKMGKTYHAPKCDWAKKIDSKNRVWFEDKAEAKKAGYKAHSCAE